MRSLTILALGILAISVPGIAQTRRTGGTITYISGNTIYTSVGSVAGVGDSSRLFVLDNGDTAAVLRVIAVSSSSSACRLERSSRNPRVGDPVQFFPDRSTAGPTAEEHAIPVRADSTAPQPTLAKVDSSITRPAAPAMVSVNGRLGLQFFTSGFSGSSQRLTQPGLVVDLRGTFSNPDFRFVLNGIFRSTVYGTLNPFSASRTDRTRLYRLSLEYNNGSTGISLGRIIPYAAPSIGYVDGLLLSQTVGGFTAGITGGFEPSFSQQGFSSDLRKFAVFTSYQMGAPMQFNGSLAYARTYMHTLLDREVMSGSVFAFPWRDLVFSAQSEADLRRKTDDALLLKPTLTNLFANLSYRLTDFLSVGAGATAFRPYYSFSTVAGIPDSLLDRTLQTGASVSANLFLPAGVSLSNSYTPRSSEEGFGRDYLDNASISVSNLFQRGITIRGTTTANRTTTTTATGVGGSIQAPIVSMAMVTLRYQAYRYTIRQADQVTQSRSMGADLNVFFGRSLTLWGTVERFTGFGAGGYTVLGEIDWRF